MQIASGGILVMVKLLGISATPQLQNAVFGDDIIQ